MNRREIAQPNRISLQQNISGGNYLDQTENSEVSVTEEITVAASVAEITVQTSMSEIIMETGMDGITEEPDVNDIPSEQALIFNEDTAEDTTTEEDIESS